VNSSIQFGSKHIQFSLQYSDRKTLGITVTPHLTVLVKAPDGASIEKVKAKLRKRAPWILKQQSFFLSFEPRTPPRKFINGETHLYLGRQYRLKVIRGKSEVVRFNGGYIEVVTMYRQSVKQLVTHWYRDRARAWFGEVLEEMVPRFRRHSAKPEGVVLRDMPLRWGSCTPKGKVILNPELIKAPRPCIEYVIAHELCHLVHRHHTKRFFELQNKVMPDWERWKGKLERILA